MQQHNIIAVANIVFCEVHSEATYKEQKPRLRYMNKETEIKDLRVLDKNK
jgi:hypothetical protein